MRTFIALGSFLVSFVMLVLSAPAYGREQPGTPSTLETRDEREAFLWCPRTVLGRLRGLNKELLQQALKRYLSSQQLDALEVRRALLVRHFDHQIASKGEAAVLYDLPPRR